MKYRKQFYCLVFLLISFFSANAQNLNVEQKLQGIEQTINQILKDWNVPGCGIGIVVKDKLVFAKGYGYRNLEKKLPVTPNTLFQIASNTKLFTATAIGFLVNDGKLEWDQPIRNFVPKIRFNTDDLNKNVTIRDMLSHRTGISRHDGIWDNSSFTRQELFDRLKYLEPSLPLRQGFLYNNLMYAAAGQIVEDLSGQTWEKFVANKIFAPLSMTHSMFVPTDMAKQSDFMSPYYEKRDTDILLPYPLYTEMAGVGPCGSIISSINDLSGWMIAQMNAGKYNGQQVIPVNIITETLKPASIPWSVPDKYFENLNGLYGMGRGISSYKGHYRTQHNGAIGGIYSQIAYLPTDSIGIVVYVNGEHGSALVNIIPNLLFDKLLDLPPTDWNNRGLDVYLKNKEAAKKSRLTTNIDRIANTKPSHSLSDYVGVYEDAAYGKLDISMKNEQLHYFFNKVSLPLNHYHYDRFDSPDDEIYGTISILFDTDAQGSIHQAKISMDEKEVVFIKKPDAKLTDMNFLKRLEGKYALNEDNVKVQILNQELVLQNSPLPPMHLIGYKNSSFRIKEFSDYIIEFIMDATDNPTGFKWIAGGKANIYVKR